MFIHRQYDVVARNRLTRKRSSSAVDKVNAKSALENASWNDIKITVKECQKSLKKPNVWGIARENRFRLAKKTKQN